MKVVERYILRRALVLFIGALVWTLAIVWTTQVLTRINLVTDNGQSALTFFQVASLIIPSIIPIVVSFAIVIAVAQTLSTMNSDSELVVINAAGGSRMTVVKPIMWLAVGASIFVFLVHNGVDPYARQRNRELVAAARADFLSLVIQEGTFRKIENGLFVQIGERLPNGRLGSIFVADSRQDNIDLVYYAKTGSIVQNGDDQVLLMNDGVIHRKTPSGDVSVIKFTSYAFDLSAFAAETGKQTLYPKDRSTWYLLNPDPADPVFKQTPGLYRSELYQRFSEWTFSIVYALIALAVAGDARSHREARIHPLITAICIALLVRGAAFFIEGKTKANSDFGYVVFAIPIVVSLISIWFIRTHRTMELPIGWTDSVISLARRAGALLSALWFRVSGRPAPRSGEA